MHFVLRLVCSLHTIRRPLAGNDAASSRLLRRELHSRVLLRRCNLDWLQRGTARCGSGNRWVFSVASCIVWKGSVGAMDDSLVRTLHSIWTYCDGWHVSYSSVSMYRFLHSGGRPCMSALDSEHVLHTAVISDVVAIVV